VSVERIFLAGRSVRIQASTRCPQAACPGCGAVSRRVHSRYERRLSDTAAGGQEVVICLTVRRFFCLEPSCKKTTFAEQVSGLTIRYGRRSASLTGALQAIALALGGGHRSRPACTGAAAARVGVGAELCARLRRLNLPKADAAFVWVFDGEMGSASVGDELVAALASS
jgi:hypothetical protein